MDVSVYQTTNIRLCEGEELMLSARIYRCRPVICSQFPLYDVVSKYTFVDKFVIKI